MSPCDQLLLLLDYNSKTYRWLHKVQRLAGVCHLHETRCCSFSVFMKLFRSAPRELPHSFFSQEGAVDSNCPLRGVLEVFIPGNVYLGFGGRVIVKGRWERRIGRLWKTKFRKDCKWNWR